MDDLPGTDFLESGASDRERATGQKIGSTFDDLDREKRGREKVKQAE